MKDWLETRATLGNLGTLRFVKSPCEYKGGCTLYSNPSFSGINIYPALRLDEKIAGNPRYAWESRDFMFATVPLRYYGSLYKRAGEAPRGARRARQKSKDPLDFWMKVWTKVARRFPSTGAGFRGLGIQKSKNPKK